VIAREDVCGNAEAGAGIDNALNVGAFDGVILEDVAGDEDRIDAMFAGDRRQSFGRENALRSNLGSAQADVFGAHADLPISGVQDFHGHPPSPSSVVRSSCR
jgi:hypothetical protein